MADNWRNLGFPLKCNNFKMSECTYFLFFLISFFFFFFAWFFLIRRNEMQMSGGVVEVYKLPASGSLSFKVLSLLWSSKEWKPPAVFPFKLAAARKSENGMKRGKKTCFSHMDTIHFKFIQISSFVLFCPGNMNLALELVTLGALTSFLGSCHQLKPWFHPVPFCISRESPFSRGERNQHASLYIFSSHQPPGLIYCHFL